MTTDGPRPLSPQLRRFGKISEVARKMIEGPRSVTPKTPKNADLDWYDPIVKLTHQLGATRSVEGVILYRLSNHQEMTSRNAMLIRHAFWDAQEDRQRCKSSDVVAPGVQVRYAFVPESSSKWIHLLLLNLDRSLTTIPFTEEGCGGSSASDEAVSSGEAEISEAEHYGLERTTRFQSLEFHWTLIAGECNFLDRSFCELFEYLKECLASAESQSNLTETYDIDPETMTDGKVIALAINALGTKSIRELRDIVVIPERRLHAFMEGGWQVHFAFVKEDQFLHRAIMVEVSRSGQASVFQNM